MNPIFLMILLSGSLFAQTESVQTELEDESYKSKKNAFESKHSELLKSHKDYWEARKKLQALDAGLLLKERNILSKKVKLADVERALDAEKTLKKKMEKGSSITKETVFIKSGNEYKTVDVNDSDYFTEPSGKESQICSKDSTKCFDYKIENGKKVLKLSDADVKTELQALKEAKGDYKREVLKEESLRRDAFNKRKFETLKTETAEKKFDRAKDGFVKYASSSSAVNEEFVDKLVKDSNKEGLFGAHEIDPGVDDTKAQVLTALNKKVFDKSTYGLLKDDAEDYQVEDMNYKAIHEEVVRLKETHNLESPALKVAAAPVMFLPDASLIKKTPVTASTSLCSEDDDGDCWDKLYAAKEVVVNGREVSAVATAPEGEQAPSTDPDDGPAGAEPVAAAAATAGEAKAEEAKTDTDSPADDGDARADAEATAAVAAEEAKKANEQDAEDTAKEKDEAAPTGVAAAEVDKSKEETPEELCRKEAIQKLLELFKNDSKNILGKQFNLTAMKTAYYLKVNAPAGSPTETLEQNLNRTQGDFAKDETITALKKLYTDKGLDGAGAGLDDMVGKMKQGQFNYFSPKSRMSNDEASKLYLLLSKSDSGVDFGMEDAAVAWAFGQINKVSDGSAASNKLSISSQVNKLMGLTIAGGTSAKISDLKSSMVATEKEINDAMKTSLKEISATCQDTLGEDCLIAGDLKHDAFAEMIKTILSKTEVKIDDKKLEGYHLEVKDFIGVPSKEDFKELGIQKLKRAPAMSESSLEKVQIAAGETVMGHKEQLVSVDKKCYLTQFEKGAVVLKEAKCK